MKIVDPEFFYSNYVGHSPEDDDAYYRTSEMIEHYTESGMTEWLPKIYECCAKNEELNARNIPRHLWAEGNLLEEGRFYLHPVLTLLNPSPQFNPETGKQIIYPYYRENIERFTLEDVLFYAKKTFSRVEKIKDFRQDLGSLRFLLNKYRPLREEGINPLDMLLFLITECKGECIDMLDLQKNEDKMVGKISAYIQKLKAMGKYGITWRGHLDDV